jgi:hypothetical protein
MLATYRSISVRADILYAMAEAKYLNEVARAAKVAPITLRRWLLAGKIAEVSRDRNGWRIFTPEDQAAILQYAFKTTPPTKGSVRKK